jgi:hypothetical protein
MTAVTYEQKVAQRIAMINAITWDVIKEAKDQADAYNIDIGHLYATSGVDPSGKYYEGRLNWAIISCSRENAQNKVCYKKSPFLT